MLRRAATRHCLRPIARVARNRSLALSSSQLSAAFDLLGYDNESRRLLHTKPASSWQQQLNQTGRLKSSVARVEDDYDDDSSSKHVRAEVQRLKHIRNVGIFAHVDAGKTTVTERMLALAGVVRRCGAVDDGNTVTDYLPAERERGITIQSAAISFEWGWHNNRQGDDFEPNDNVTISLIDTPGHIDFSVEVSRSVAVLDGAVLVVDAVAGVQAQTETVWRAMTRPSLNNHDDSAPIASENQDHAHEPLSCIAVINKMDKIGSNFGTAVKSLAEKLPGANPVPIQIPIFRVSTSKANQGSLFDDNIVAASAEDANSAMHLDDFVGVIDLIHMRAVVYPDVFSNSSVANVEDCVPEIIPLLCSETHEPLDENCQVTQQAFAARYELIESLAEIDERIEEFYMNEEEPSNAEIRLALRRAILSHRVLPVMAAAAVRGKGVEPVIDAIADLLPSPLDRMPPALNLLDGNVDAKPQIGSSKVTLGHALHPSTLALAFKVVHMKGRGGSGDGRVVFARVYSGMIKDGDVIQVVSPPAPGEAPDKPRKERVGGMLELAGGRFGNLEGGTCRSGDVCALVGLRSVVTGDTILIPSDGKASKKFKKKNTKGSLCLAGVSSPKPVLKVRLEAETSVLQSELSNALRLLAIEDPSLLVEETDSATLLSGLGELHIEVTLDRLKREFGLDVLVGRPTVTYRETIEQRCDSGGLVEYDHTIGGTRLQGSVHLVLEPTAACENGSGDACMMLVEPSVTVGQEAREFLGLDGGAAEDELMLKSEPLKALVEGCVGALKRGPLGTYSMANVNCHVVNVDMEGGVAAAQEMPGSLRAAAANAVSMTLSQNNSRCTILEPTMSVEVSLPNDMVGSVLSDLTGRRGSVGDVVLGEGKATQVKALVRGAVPLVEILGYADSLRSLTGGEGAFTAEYKGHSPCSSSAQL